MRLYQADSFTTTPFAGNPAAVCLLDEAADETWMRQVAAEMNLSETAFLHPIGDAWSLRWFTPAVEVKLCGHATLASAHIMWSEGIVPNDRPLHFDTLSGRLTATPHERGIMLDFPATTAVPVAVPAGLLEALGLAADFVGKNQYDYLVEVKSADTVRAVGPDFGALKKLGVRGVMVTARSDSPEYDFISRFFAPGAGIDEDPVTGSAHCTLAPYWSAKLGKTEMRAYQASRRGGQVEVELAGDRVRLIGRAVTVMTIDLLV